VSLVNKTLYTSRGGICGIVEIDAPHADVVTKFDALNTLSNLVYTQQFNGFNDLSHKMGMNHVMHMPTTDPLQDGQQFNDFNNLRHKM
jgi:hypothetical protein